VSDEQNRPHPNSPAGAGGPGGFRSAGPLGNGAEPGNALAEPGLMNLRVPGTLASHPGWLGAVPQAGDPVFAVRSASRWEDLQHIAEPILGPTSFNLGVCYGMVENLASGVASILNLLKTFVLEGIYEQIHHPPPWWATSLYEQYALARLWAFAIGEPRLEEAHRQCVALLGELKRVVTEPRKFFSQLGDRIVKEYEEKWERYKEEMNRGTIGGDFQAGRITGQVLLDVIMLLLAVYGAAELAAKAAAEIPELLDLVRGLRGADTALKVKTPISVPEAAADAADDLAEKPKVEDPAEQARPKSLRDQYMGRTPGKNSRTGRLVQDRMRAAGTLREDADGATEFQASNGNWYPLDEADMAHKTDAVKWWNETGRQYGAKSPEVRAWMLDPDNYTLDHYSLNRSAGAQLPDTYLPPLK
jgi:hypothetical protein